MSFSGRIYVIRHGEDTDNAAGILNGHRDTELTELGRSQARIVARKLRRKGITLILTSPLKRAYNTALIIAHEIGIGQVEVDARLQERDFGILTGKPIAKIKKYASSTFKGDRVTYFIEAPGAEDFPSLLGRGWALLEEVTGRYPEGIILFVTHGDIGKMIHAAFRGWTWERALGTLYFGNTDVLELSHD